MSQGLQVLVAVVAAVVVGAMALGGQVAAGYGWAAVAALVAFAAARAQGPFVAAA